jgi:hypothetical protein
MKKSLSFFRFIFLAILSAFLGLHPLALAADAVQSAEETTALRKQIATLKAENESLKKENERLKQMLAQTREPKSVIPTPLGSDSTSLQNSSATPKATGYWMTTTSSKRHNSSCRYYMNSKGHPCGPNEGIACKICGG